MMSGAYLQGQDPKTPSASPLFADLTGLPVTLVLVGTNEAPAATRYAAWRPTKTYTKLTYVRGPSGIIVMFAQELKKD